LAGLRNLEACAVECPPARTSITFSPSLYPLEVFRILSVPHISLVFPNVHIISWTSMPTYGPAIHSRTFPSASWRASECFGSRISRRAPLPALLQTESPFAQSSQPRRLKIFRINFYVKASGGPRRRRSVGRLIWSGPFPADVRRKRLRKVGLSVSSCVTCALAPRARQRRPCNRPTVSFHNKLSCASPPELFQTYFLDRRARPSFHSQDTPHRLIRKSISETLTRSTISRFFAKPPALLTL